MAESKPFPGWQVHEAEQRRAWLKLSPLERLRWLEDRKRFITLALGAARKQRSRERDEG